ncbi:ABC transporter ATP-binding protein [Leucobacter aridicollis]|uniref:ABC transporter ATP-binding protein n=1 Tax=Leucobacter aridicollis TaxID=283878 RepID=UPI0021076E0B|nr:ABC transporter ATP-binding protein [Leucobacter aridicollis]UTX53512.1 ABC transporter ATP-binding protein [Leucobacter aridicollis]
MANAISITNASKTFHVSGQAIPALADINLDIEEGAFVSLLGPSGCGKSTLLRLIGDLLDPDEGAVGIFGKSAKTSRRDRDYGMVFQQPGLMDWRTIQQNVELPLQVAGVNAQKRASKARELLELVRLDGFENHRPRQLSGGMQQRAAIARALSFEPKILLMDEPLGALDEMNREYLQRELLRIWRETGTTIVFVTHSVSEATFLSTEVVVMSPRPGRIATRIPIDLPYPRVDDTRSSEAFHDAETHVREALHSVLEPTVAGV